MSKIAILQSNYIPWKGYFDLINKVDCFVVYDETQFTKNDWRNRNLIKTKEGTAWLTIPVFQHSIHQKINETKISQHNWNIKHWNTLVTNYAKAPYFMRYKPLFEALYMNQDSNYLSEINLNFLTAVCGVLNVKTKIIRSEQLLLSGNRTERLVDACIKLKANAYLTGPSAKNYLEVDLFEDAGIAVEWMSYDAYPEYPQLFPPFNHFVSVLDVLFNTGEMAPQYMFRDVG